MADLMYVALALLFLFLSYGLIQLCEKLMEEQP